MEKAFKELILALRGIGDALMGKINSSNNDNNEGGFLRNYNTVVGVKGIGVIYRYYDNTNTVIGIEDIAEETPVFLFDKTKSLNENFKLFYSQNIEFMMNMEEGISEVKYELLPVYENNDNKIFYDFDCFDIEVYDRTDEYYYDDFSEFLSSENCEMCIRCYNMTYSWNPDIRENMGFIPVDNKHYIIFFNDCLALQSNNNNDDIGVAKGVRKSSSESEESFKSFINLLKENRERNKKEREERNENRRKAFLEFLNKLKKTEEKEEEQKENAEEIKEEVKEEVKEEMKESEKSSELETKQEETK